MSNNQTTARFWNDREVVKWFYDYPYSDYWVEFFTAIKNKTKIRVLDLGCGGGRNAQMLVDMGFDVYTCDLYAGMVAATKKRLSELGMNDIETSNRVKLVPMHDLPYETNQFDIVLSHGVYHNAMSWAEYKNSIAESARILRPGGCLCFNLFTSGFLASDFVNKGKHLYETKEKLLMVLISKDELIELAKTHHLVPHGRFVEYESQVTTGKRSVLRGVFKKL